MHLTLKFLGEVPDNQIVEVCNIVKEVAGRYQAFDFAVQEVGSFGGRSARVLWVGAGLECPELLELQQDLEDELAEAGWPKEGRQFSGHLTLCRIRNSQGRREAGPGRSSSTRTTIWAWFTPDAVIVFESQLTPARTDLYPFGNVINYKKGNGRAR